MGNRFRVLSKRHLAICLVAWLVVFCGVCIDAAPLKPGDILVANGFGGNVIKVDPVTGAQEVFAAGDMFSRPLGITVTDDGRIFVTDERTPGGSLLELDPATGDAKLRTTPFNRAVSGVAVGSDGTIYVSEQLGTRSVAHINPESYSIVTRSGGPLYNRPMLSTFLDNGLLVVPNRGNGNINLLDPVSGQSTLLASGLGSPQGSAVEADGTILAVNGDTLFRINPDTGVVTTLARGFRGSVDAAVELDGSILVSVRGTEMGVDDFIYRIDPVTGRRSEVTSFGELQEAFGIAVYVPEPTTFVALGMGLVVALRRRRP